MELILDTADVQAITYYNDYLKLSGVTTNPSIITKSKKEPKIVLNEILKILSDDQDLYVQVISTDVDGIVEEAKQIAALRPLSPENIYVKIPVSNEGLKAIKEVKKLNIKILATAIYTPEQGILAALAGADKLAPYVNRMCNYTDGVRAVIDLFQMIQIHGLPTKIVAASFKNMNQVHELLKNGVHSVTVPVDVLSTMMNHPATDEAVNTFSQDWQTTYQRNTLF